MTQEEDGTESVQTESPDPIPSSEGEALTTPEPIQGAPENDNPFATDDVLSKVKAQDKNRGDVSAATIGRMMGLATTNEIQYLEGKLDLVATRINNLTVRMERLSTILSNAPQGKDLERIDVQISSLRTMIKESLVQQQTDTKSEAMSSSRVSDTRIKTN